MPTFHLPFPCSLRNWIHPAWYSLVLHPKEALHGKVIKVHVSGFFKGVANAPIPPLAANRAKPPPPIHGLHVKHKLFEFSLYCAVEWHGELQDYDCNLMPVCILSWMWERNNCQLDEEPNQEQHKMYLLWITSYNGLLCMFFFYIIHV